MSCRGIWFYLALMVVPFSGCRSSGGGETSDAKDIVLDGDDGFPMVVYLEGDIVKVRECDSGSYVAAERDCTGVELASMPRADFSRWVAEKLGIPNYQPDENGTERIRRLVEQAEADRDNENLSEREREDAAIQAENYRRQLEISEDADEIMQNLDGEDTVTYLPYRRPYKVIREIFGGGHYCTYGCNSNVGGTDQIYILSKFHQSPELASAELARTCQVYLHGYPVSNKCIEKKVSPQWQGCPNDDDCDGVENSVDRCPGTMMGSIVPASGERAGCQ